MIKKKKITNDFKYIYIFSFKLKTVKLTEIKKKKNSYWF